MSLLKKLFGRKDTASDDGLYCSNAAPPISSVPPPVSQPDTTEKPVEPAHDPVMDEHYQVDISIKTTTKEFSWTCPFKEEAPDISRHYDNFVDWYHGGETELYVMEYITGVTCIKRSDVLWYSITKRPEYMGERTTRIAKAKAKAVKPEDKTDK